MIILNSIKCVHCLDVIVSEHRHDFQACSCGKVFVDGGHDYQRVGFESPGDYINLSKYGKDEDA